MSLQPATALNDSKETLTRIEDYSVKWLKNIWPQKTKKSSPDIADPDLGNGLQLHLRNGLEEFEADGIAFKALAEKVSRLVGGEVIAQTPSGCLFHPKFIEELKKPGNERLWDFATSIQKMGS